MRREKGVGVIQDKRDDKRVSATTGETLRGGICVRMVVEHVVGGCTWKQYRGFIQRISLSVLFI